MTPPSGPRLAVVRRAAVALAVLLSEAVSFQAGAGSGALGDLTADTSGCGVTMTCAGSGSGGTPLPGGTGGVGQCTPNGAGSPCGSSSGPASQPASTTGQNVGAGNPINVLSGNKYQREVDLPPLPGVLGLEIVRHYNSQYARPNVAPGSFGRGWKLSYETDLYVVRNTVQIVQADGTRIIFARDAKDPSRCATRDPSRGTVRVQSSPAGESFVWIWPEGRRLFFDARGKLVQIVAPTGEFVSLTRDATGALLKVTDPQGRSLVLSYGSKAEKDAFRGVRFIDSPVGRFAYAYGSSLPAGAGPAAAMQVQANLVSVTLPAAYAATEKAHPWANRGTTQSAVTRSYHYESARHPTLLTGISVAGSGSDGAPMQVRLSSWDYDGQARATLSVKGERSAADAAATVAAGAPEAPRPPLQGEGRGGEGVKGVGPETVRLAFPQPGTTVLTNSLGQTTTYRWAPVAGELRLLEALGPGCASCGPTNVRYAYDAAGRLSVSTQLDAQGKPLFSTRFFRDDAGRLVREERFRFVQGQPRPAGWVRFEYAPAPAVPARTGADGESLALPDPKPLRVIRPSVVAGKTHEWRYAYNAAGQVVSVTESGFAPARPDEGKRGEPTPIERTTTYTYTTVNGRSLLTSIDGPLPNGPHGDPSDSDVTTLTWDSRGDFVTGVTAPGNQSFRLQWDEGSRRLASVTLVWADTVRRLRNDYAATGHLASRTLDILTPDGQGVLGSRSVTYERDAINQLSAIGWFDGTRSRLPEKPDGAPSGFRSGNEATLADRNEPMLEAKDSGQASTFSDGLRAVLGAAGSVVANEVVRFETDARSAERLFDDFGRVIAVRNPGQGWQVAQYDAADRLTRTVEASGTHRRLAYNLAGQLERLEYYAAHQDMPEETVSIHWHGPYREEETVSDAEGRLLHRKRYAYSMWGERTREEVEIFEASTGRTVRLRQSLRYDAAGRLVSRSLPSGTRIAYRYVASGPAAGELAQVERIAWAPWLDFLMTRLPEGWQPKTVLPGPAGRDGEPDRPAETAAFAERPDAPLPEPGLADPDTAIETDADGLPSRLPPERGGMRLTWNAAHQLVAVDDPQDGHPVARYTYDARGRRASKTTSRGKEFYLYEGTQLIAVWRDPTTADSASGARWHEFLYEGYRPVAWFADGQAFRLASDHRGAVTAVQATTPESAPLWESGIDAWGNVDAKAAGSRFDPGLRLVNQYADEETGLSYNVGRYYDPRTGRFISPDPAGIADSIDPETPAALKLDITAYAAGQPSLYFDPDGAARLIYYAITSGANGQALGSTQGFSKARWAFTVEGLRADGTGGSAAINQLMQTYASNGTGLLYDAGGNFLTAGQKQVTWSGGAGGVVDMFKEHYGNNLISISPFTIDNFSNRDAALLIASLTGNTEGLGTCISASGLLPEINFGPEDVPINVTDATRPQRILNCGALDMQSTTQDAIKNRMLLKLSQAIAINEVNKVYPDCAGTGCPSNAGIYLGQNHQFAKRTPAAYSYLQFAPETLTEILFDAILSASGRANAGITDADLQTLALDQGANAENIAAVQTAGNRARWVYVYAGYMLPTNNPYRNYSTNYGRNCPTSLTLSTPWNQLSDNDKTNFSDRTGLGADAWSYMQRYVANNLESGADFVSGTNSKEILDALAWAAWNTNATAQTWFSNLVQSSGATGRFQTLANAYLRYRFYQIENTESHALHQSAETLYPLANNGTAEQQQAIDVEIAARLARRHNGGSWWRSIAAMKASPADHNNYVKKIYGDSNFANAGNFPSLRCAGNLANAGYVMTPLQL